ncbi:uncharacterized protein LOC133473285 isoform X2 [Phyllopteryx taeniolatus]|uniref:uncharacterized protein LOC133473285 isoform X2 n=1 Tax=Phyllopteryx taeniolatus TaxID=161469 RepID=UPI002AD2F99A|nr:uncharacterized protein LOC133473285 isoform X2 [Phyllopteryx taeniolatus]
MCARRIAEYDEELSGAKEETDRQRERWTLISSNLQLCHAQQKEWSTRVAYQEPEQSHIKEEETPETPHVKEEEEEADITKFLLTGVIVKSEDDEDQEVSEKYLRPELQEPESSPNKEEVDVADINKLLLTDVALKTEDEGKGQHEEERRAEPQRSSSSQHVTTEVQDWKHWILSSRNQSPRDIKEEQEPETRPHPSFVL